MQIAAGIGVWTSLQQAVRGVTGAISDLVKTSLVLAASFETAQAQFGILLGSLDEGRKLARELREISRESIFEFRDLQGTTRLLLAFGVGQREVVDATLRLSEVAAGTGANVRDIALAYGQIRSVGRLLGQDMRQLVTRGVPLMETLADVLDKPIAEIQRMQESGEISFNDVRQAFIAMTNEGGRFAGAMEKAADTIEGRWKQLTKELKFQLQEIGLELNETFGFKQILENTRDFVKDMGLQFASLTIKIETELDRIRQEFNQFEFMFRVLSGNVTADEVLGRQGRLGPDFIQRNVNAMLREFGQQQADAAKEPIEAISRLGPELPPALKDLQMEMKRFREQGGMRIPDISFPDVFGIRGGIVDDPFFGSVRGRRVPQRRGGFRDPLEAFESRLLTRAPGRVTEQQQILQSNKTQEGLLSDVHSGITSIKGAIETLIRAVKNAQPPVLTGDR